MYVFFFYVTGLQSKIPYFNKNTPTKSVSGQFCQESSLNEDILLKLQEYYRDSTSL